MKIKFLDTDIDFTIRKIPESIKKYGLYFKLLDEKYIINLLIHTVNKQNAIMNQTCVTAKGVNVDELQSAFRYVLSKIPSAKYKEILTANTENYDLFRSTTSVVATYMFFTIYGIYLRNIELVEYSYFSYAMFIYPKLFAKFIPYCNPSDIERALKQSHGLSLFAREFRKKSHLGVLDIIVNGEVKKLIDSINSGKYNQLVFTRSFSYIKTRINQTLKSFAQVYHKVIKQSGSQDQEGGVSFSQMSMMISQLKNTQTRISSIPDSYVNPLIRDLKLDPIVMKDFYQTALDLSTKHDKTFLEMVDNLYTLIFKTFMKNIDKICEPSFISLLTKVVVVKNAGLELQAMKKSINDIVMYIVSKSDNEILKKNYVNKYNIGSLRKAYIRFVYYIYIKPTLCQ